MIECGRLRSRARALTVRSLLNHNEKPGTICTIMTGSITARTIVDARLSMPNLARDVVTRPGILRQLAASPSQRVTLVCAPAGYGKTTAVVSWLQSRAQQA